jgi:hypothetical protein
VLTPERRRQLFTRAETYASRLAGAGVTRAELRPVLNALFLPPQPWPARLEATRRLADALPGSWVGKRSNRTPQQLAAVRDALREILRGDTAEPELRFLLGWLARLLHLCAGRGNGPGRPRPERRDRDPRDTGRRAGGPSR